MPSLKRDVLLEIAERTIYRPLWSAKIFDEAGRAIMRINDKLGNDADVTATYVRRLTAQMEQAFPDALVTGWEPLVPTITSPDPNDRHVVAAALTGRADVIVTENRRTSLPRRSTRRCSRRASTHSCSTPSTDSQGW